MSAPISALSQALQLMRAGMAQAGPRTVQAGASPLPNPSLKAASSGGPASAHTSTQLDALRSRLRAARAQPGGLTPAHALRLFVEAALVDEWGTELQLDAGFHDLVERTCKALEADEAQSHLLITAMRELDSLG